MSNRLTHNCQKMITAMMMRCGILLAVEPRSVIVVYRALAQLQWKQQQGEAAGNQKWDPRGVVYVPFQRICLQLL
jgi:hypothetical protein